MIRLRAPKLPRVLPTRSEPMANGAEHEPGNHWGTLVAIGTGVVSIFRALLSRRPKQPEIDPEEELDAAASRGSRRAIILAQLDENEVRMDRLQTQSMRNAEGIAQNQAGIDRLERLIVQMKQALLDELDTSQRHLMRVIDDRCSEAKGRKPEP